MQVISLHRQKTNASCMRELRHLPAKETERREAYSAMSYIRTPSQNLPVKRVKRIRITVTQI